MKTISMVDRTRKELEDFFCQTRQDCRRHSTEYQFIETQVKAAIQRSVILGYHEGVVEAYQILAIINMNKGDGEMAYNALQMSENFIVKYQLNKANYLELYNTMVIYYQDFLGDGEMAAQMCQKGIVLARELGHKKMLMKFTANLGTMNVLFGNYEDAIRNIKSALVYYKSIHDDIRSLYCLTNLGEAYYEAASYKEAKNCYERGLEIAIETEQTLIIEEAAVGLAKLYTREGEMDKAISLLEAMRVEVQACKQMNVGIKILLELMKLYVSKKDYIRADLRMDEFESNYTSQRNAHIKMMYKELKSEIAIGFGDYKLAHELVKEHHQLYVKANEDKTAKILSNIKTTQLMGTIDRLERIGNVGRKLNQNLSDDHLLMTLVEELSYLLPMDNVGVGLVEGGLVNYSFYQLDMEEHISFQLPLNEDTYGNWVINRGKELMVNDLSSENNLNVSKVRSKLNQLDGKYTESMILVPLAVEEKVVGLISVQSNTTMAYTGQDLETLKVIGSYVAIAVVNTHQTKALRSLSYKDQLTGVYNRTGMLKAYGELTHRSLTSLHMIMMDLDYFKEVNDRYGHGLGDKVLERFGYILKKYASKYDGIAVRLGGEEFALILCNISDERCEELGQAFMLEVRNMDLIHGEEKVAITTSMGIYHDRCGECPTIDKVYKYADRALYLAKRGGRDKIEVYN